MKQISPITIWSRDETGLEKRFAACNDLEDAARFPFERWDDTNGSVLEVP
jgi:hypothetical protein